MTPSESPIILATVNAKYIHSSFGLRYLKANMNEFEPQTQIMEFTLQERPVDIAEALLQANPQTIGLSCYIWNISVIDEIVRILKAIQPQVQIILGGPEVSFPNDLPSICELADHIICGEGEVALPNLLRNKKKGITVPLQIIASPVDLNSINLPYALYTESDLAHRLIYVETSRGCAFGCEFCLSSLDPKVRYFQAENVINALTSLWDRGVRQFKFIDRTIHLSKAKHILDFFAARICPELFVHFEIVPDQISDELISVLKQFPRGAIQLEAGVQTFNDNVSKRIGRKQRMDKTAANIKKIVQETGVHIHSDLVIGLPGETIESISLGFNKLLQTDVHEIQVGILKRLRGAPISRHTTPFKMVYNHTAPYEILQNNLISFADMQRLKRFSRYFDLVHNNGNFKSTTPLLWQGQPPFQAFLAFSDWLFSQCHRTAGIALDRLATYIFDYLVNEQNCNAEFIANQIQQDFAETGRRRLPKCVRDFVTIDVQEIFKSLDNKLPERQKRHSQ